MTNPLVAIRREVVSHPILEWLKCVLPEISDTGRKAHEAGPSGDHGGLVRAARIGPPRSQGVIR